ncbi:hypothetical protein HPB48_004271 [Haemaphysalis longicornis]|uniref:Uncharacterized protein n=1 Tax=Haemaphysalis longicornis TaxID=44386 RepID=A0A9J6GV53_HAELO|nr:hypothetical protein HPB48_004271 [Haemaphysalis longicornis]
MLCSSSQRIKGDYLIKDFYTNLEVLWNHNVTHYGILNANLDYSSTSAIEMALAILKIIKLRRVRKGAVVMNGRLKQLPKARPILELFLRDRGRTFIVVSWHMAVAS